MSDEQTGANLDTTIARKLQTKTIVGNVRKYVPKVGEDGKPTGVVQPLYQIYGQAISTKRGEGDNGPWVALLGRFEAVNITPDGDGTLVTGPQCFLPEPMSSMMATELESMVEALDDEQKPILDKDGNPKMVRAVDSLEFGFEIGVKATETPIGYEYVTKPVIKSGGADPLASLRRRIPAVAQLQGLPPQVDKPMLESKTPNKATKAKK